GAYLRTTMETLATFGAPPERYWQYNIAKFDLEPTAFCYAFAQNYQAIKYFRLDPNGATGAQTLQNIKNFLAAGFPSMFGFPVYDEYMHLPANGDAAFPAPQSHLYGGHANVAVGYDDNLMIGADKGALLVRNSWGTGSSLPGELPYLRRSSGCHRSRLQHSRAPRTDGSAAQETLRHHSRGDACIRRRPESQTCLGNQPRESS